MSGWELSANALNAVSIIFAGRNSVHTWWIGIFGCLAFAYVFFVAKLYADVVLQVFFVVTSVFGWWNWLRGKEGAELPIRRSSPGLILATVSSAVIVALGYGWLLYRFTDAYAPFIDSLILAFSVLGQFLLMGRRIETWWCWLLVNTIAIPLFASRGLHLTAVLYAGFWINAVVSLYRWRKLLLANTR